MRPLLSPAETGEADRAAITGGTPAGVLMERAGRAVARAAIEVAGGRYGRRAVIVCGKGNNGGDGYVAARVLAAEGLAVTCLSVVDLSGVTGAAREHLDGLRASGARVEDFDPRRLAGADVVVDAIFGTGFKGQAEGDPARAIEAINSCAAPVVAVDIPSGVDGTTGVVEGPAVAAQLTVSMAAEKWGTAMSVGAMHAGQVRVVDIGTRLPGSQVWVPEVADAAAVLPRRRADAHKRSAGSVAVLAGSEGMSGAAILTARGAVRMGVGYATLGSSPSVARAKATVLPEVLSEVVTEEVLGPEALERFEEVMERADALAIGPGLGRGEAQRELMVLVLDQVDVPVVVDADGLNALAGATAALEERRAPAVITPHPAELARLVDVQTSAVQADRLGTVRSAARRFGCVALLKGYRTVVAAPDGRAVVNPTGGPSLASAGTGDVLTGAVAALVAAGLEPFEAAWAAAFVHGVAGDEAARAVGGAGVLAWDVAEALPRAIESIRAWAPTPRGPRAMP